MEQQQRLIHGSHAPHGTVLSQDIRRICPALRFSSCFGFSFLHGVKPEISALLQTPGRSRDAREESRKSVSGIRPEKGRVLSASKASRGTPEAWEGVRRGSQTALEKDNAAGLHRMPPQMKTASLYGVVTKEVSRVPDTLWKPAAGQHPTPMNKAHIPSVAARGRSTRRTLSCLRCALERMMGVEPTPSAWKADVLPLNYTRMCKLIDSP